MASSKTISPMSIAGNKTPDRVNLADPGTVPPVSITNEKTTAPVPDLMITSESQDQNTPPYPKGIMKKDTKYDKMEKEYELVPPDGGWGWAIMLATALSNLILIPISQTFGLLYRDTFTDLGMSATDSSVIVNVNSAFGMLLAFGINIIPPSFSLALNSYFLRLKGRAMGFASTIMAIGPILIPPLISQLMDLYGVQGTSLILSALALHTLLGAFLLQPIKWHLVKREISPEEARAIAINEEYYKETFMEEMGTRRSLFESARESRKMGRRIRTVTSMSSINHDMDSTSIYGLETHMYNSEGKFKNRSFVIENTNQMSRQTDGPPMPDQKVFWLSGASIASANSIRLIDEKMYEPLHEADEESQKEDEETELQVKNVTHIEDGMVLLDDGTTNDGRNVPKTVARKPSKNVFQSVNSIDSLRDMLQRGFFHRLMRRIFVALDLGLLQDPIYVNIMLGMSFAICAENNFSLVTPFILGDLGFSNDRIAAVMSTLAAADLVLRFLSPFFADYMGYSSRTITFESVLIVSIGLGVAKGVRTVYMALVIPSYVPIERLAAASGLQMVVNGVFLLVFGPFLAEELLLETNLVYRATLFVNVLEAIPHPSRCLACDDCLKSNKTFLLCPHLSWTHPMLWATMCQPPFSPVSMLGVRAPDLGRGTSRYEGVSEWTSHSTRRATARRGRAQPTTQGKKGEGEWANHAARGFIRDISGSYNLAIVAINSLTALTITMWLIEIIIVACRDRKKNKTNT
uniref:Monocarboxylate transporter n=1 Tax=Timema shepardi TaxID=629360 RepID=A0A7R9B165_TIMSH|nr:unnamed protein product [Timema shepardi]